MSLHFTKPNKKDYIILGASFVFSLLCGIFSPGGRHLSYFLTALPWSLASAYSLVFCFKKCRQDRHWIWRIALTLILNIATVSLLLRNETWPNNHEYVSFNSRTICYAMHYKECDFLPIWGSGESNNMGEPMPLYYHKLFYHISGPIYMFTENIKGAVVGAIIIFNIIGIIGLYKLFRRLKIPVNSAFLLALCLIFQNYVATEIFVRGALAELSAFMVLPWLLWWCLKFLQEEKYDHKLPLILFAVYLGHSIIAFYGVFMLMIFFVIKIISSPEKKQFLQLLKNGAISAIIFGLLLSPIAIIMYKLSEYYDPSTIKFSIRNHYIDFYKYFFDDDYIWRLHYDNYTVQLNILLWLTIIVLSLTLGVKAIQRKIKLIPDYGFIAFSLSFLFFLFLQLRSSIFFYDTVPGADYIQFPWRLLCFIVTIGIVLIGYLVQKTANTTNISTQTLSLTLLIGFCFGFPMYKSTSGFWKWIDEKTYQREAYYGVYGIGEYTPVVEGVDVHADENVFEKLHFMGRLYHQGVVLEIPEAAKASRIPYKQEKLEVEFNIEAQKEMQAIFPVNYSGLEVLIAEYDNGETKKLTAYRNAKDPRIHCKIPEGNYKLVIHLPSYFNLFL